MAFVRKSMSLRFSNKAIFKPLCHSLEMHFISQLCIYLCLIYKWYSKIAICKLSIFLKVFLHSKYVLVLFKRVGLRFHFSNDVFVIVQTAPMLGFHINFTFVVYWIEIIPLLVVSSKQNIVIRRFCSCKESNGTCI